MKIAVFIQNLETERIQKADSDRMELEAKKAEYELSLTEFATNTYIELITEKLKDVGFTFKDFSEFLIDLSVEIKIEITGIPYKLELDDIKSKGKFNILIYLIRPGAFIKDEFVFLSKRIHSDIALYVIRELQELAITRYLERIKSIADELWEEESNFSLVPDIDLPY